MDWTILGLSCSIRGLLINIAYPIKHRKPATDVDPMDTMDQFRDDDDWRRFHREAQVEMGLVEPTRDERLRTQVREQCKAYGLEYNPTMTMYDVMGRLRVKIGLNTREEVLRGTD